MQRSGEDSQASILIVDDRPANLLALEAVLEPLGQRVVKAGSGEEALKLLLMEEFACILLDVQMPRLDGFETARLIQEREKTRHIPVLFLTAFSREEVQVLRGYSAGAVDYLVKPLEPNIVRAKVKVFVELYRREERIRERERAGLDEELRLRSRVLDSMAEGVSVSDERGIIIFTNPAEDRMFGYARGELVGRHVTVQNAYLPQENRRIVSEVIAQLQARGEWSGEWLNKKKDGTSFMTRASITALDIKGRPHWVCVQEDVTEEKRAQEERERFFQLAPDMFCIIGSDGFFKRVNSAFRSTLGWAEEELRARPVVSFIHPEDLPSATAEFEKLSQGAASIRFESRYECKDGTYKRLAWAATPYPELGLVYGSARDLTEERRAKAALVESERQFQTLADSIPQLAWIAEADGSIHWYNRRWYEYTGTTLAEMEDEDGWGWKKVHDAQELPRVVERFKTAIASGEPWEDTFPLRRQDGELRWHLSRALPLRDDSGRIVRWFGTNTDVEDSRRQALELREAVEARDTFLAVASHELKTPLTPLALRLAQLKREAQAVPPGQQPGTRELRNLDVAEAQVKKLALLVDGLLDVSRLSEGRLFLVPEDLDVAQVVREVAQAMAPQIERAGSPLHLDIPTGVRGRLDRLRLGQVVSNLLSNAVKFGPGKPIEVKLLALAERVQLQVRDEGIGISLDALERIFNKFERAVSEHHYGGLGLGLWLTREIVEAMGGTVRAESVPGGGATFTVELPLFSSSVP